MQVFVELRCCTLEFRATPPYGTDALSIGGL